MMQWLLQHARHAHTYTNTAWDISISFTLPGPSDVTVVTMCGFRWVTKF